MRRSAILTLCVLSALSLPAAAPDLAPLERKVEALRGLKFRDKVESKLVDSAGMRDVVQAELGREYSESEWPKMEKTLKAFGFIPPKMNLKAAISSLMEEQVAGLYDPRSRRLYVSSTPLQEEDLLGEIGIQDFKMTDVFVVHELDHALTDQHFKLLSLPIEDKENEDRASAARCVVEGDATWVMLRYLYQVMDIPEGQQQQMGDLMATMGLGKELMGQSIPAYLQENLLIGYLGGLSLVKAAYDRSGYRGVDALYARPPASMEQVLHPEKYFAGKDPPQTVLCAYPRTWEGKGWSELSKGVWGELNTKILLLEWGVDETAAVNASEGWGGDAYRALTGPSQALGFVWATEWDTEKDAVEFASAARRGPGVTVEKAGRRVTVTKGGPGRDGAREAGSQGAGEKKR